MAQTLTPVATDSETVAKDAAGAPTARPALAALLAIGVPRLLVLAAAAIGLLVFFALLVLRVVEPEYTLLYAGLELDDSAQIVGRLEAMGVPHRLGDEGAAILVPRDRALRLRMTLAEDGLPRGGTVGDEIFDQASPLGTTSTLADINRRRALEGELARTIASLVDVRAARVHLVLPKRELFRRTSIEPSASVALRMLGGRRLERRQVVAIQHLVAAAVPGLSPGRITLVDDLGTLLARGGDSDPAQALPSQAEEMRQAYEDRLKATIEQLLERSLGPGQVQAEVHAEMNFDQVTVTEETFDPEGQVVRSTQASEEETRQSERDSDDAVSVGNNLPNAAADTPAALSASDESTTRSEETINYEISRRVRNRTLVGGRVERLSVAVLVDGRMTPDETGQLVYSPLEEAELAQIDSLVRSAIGYDADRGDVVEIKNMPFTEPALPEVEEAWPLLARHDLMRLAELAALALVTLMLILLVVRPTLNRLLPAPAALAAPGAVAVGGPEGTAALAAPDGTPALAGPDVAAAAGQGMLVPAGAGGEEQIEGSDATIDVAHVEGRVRMRLLDKARQVIDQSPDDAVAIIRAWLQEA